MRRRDRRRQWGSASAFQSSPLPPASSAPHPRQRARSCPFLLRTAMTWQNPQRTCVQPWKACSHNAALISSTSCDCTLAPPRTQAQHTAGRGRTRAGRAPADGRSCRGLPGTPFRQACNSRPQELFVIDDEYDCFLFLTSLLPTRAAGALRENISALPDALARSDSLFFCNGRVQICVPQVLSKYAGKFG
jgi:hypothetical protein